MDPLLILGPSLCMSRSNDRHPDVLLTVVMAVGVRGDEGCGWRSPWKDLVGEDGCTALTAMEGLGANPDESG